jgi:DNA-binding GntR family transcriptional regulator
MYAPENVSANVPPPPAKPRERRLLKDKAYVQVKQWIQDGHFVPGSFLSERALAAQLGMSKTPVRAALEHLGAEGLVNVLPKQGIIVLDLSLREAAHLFELRTALELFVVRHISGRLNQEQIDHLKANLDAQQQAVERDDAITGTRLDIEFHVLLTEFLNNPEVTRVVRAALDKLYRMVLRIMLQVPGRLAVSSSEHASIAESVIAGDVDEAVRRMEQHLSFGRDFQRRSAAASQGQGM